MSGSANAIESTATSVVEGFESIPHRLKALGERIAEGIAHPFAPPVVKETLPLLMGILETLSQEVAELRKPCPCAPSDVVGSKYSDASSTSTETTATVVPTLREDMTAKWPTYDHGLAAYLAGEMNDAEKAAFEPIHAQVQAFTKSIGA